VVRLLLATPLLEEVPCLLLEIPLLLEVRRWQQ
jgi:hypothetical protein